MGIIIEQVLLVFGLVTQGVVLVDASKNSVFFVAAYVNEIAPSTQSQAHRRRV